MDNLHYIVRDLQRRLANMIKRGRVHSVDLTQTPPRVRVEYEKDCISAWLPWSTGRASNQSVTQWEPPTVGEQVLMLSESGELAAAIVIACVHDASNPPPSTSENEHVTKYSDDTTIIYDRETHKLNITIGTEGTAEFNVKTFTLNGDLVHNGNATVKGNQTITGSETRTGNSTQTGNTNITGNAIVSAAVTANAVTAATVAGTASVTDPAGTMAEIRTKHDTHKHGYDGNKTTTTPSE